MAPAEELTVVIPLAWVVAGTVGLVVGLLLGWKAGRLYELAAVRRRLALAKDGELWQANHYLAADEEAEKKKANTDG